MTLYYIIISQIVFCHCIYIYTSVVKLLSKWSYYILWTWIYEGTIWKGCEETGSTLTIQAHGSSRCFPIKSLVRDVPRVQNVRTHPYFRVGWDAAWPSLHGSWLLFEIEHMSTTRESVWKFKGNSVDRHVPYWDGQFRGWSPIPHRPRFILRQRKTFLLCRSLRPSFHESSAVLEPSLLSNKTIKSFEDMQALKLCQDTPVDGLGYFADRQKMFTIHEGSPTTISMGWHKMVPPVDSVQLVYKWLNSVVYGRYNELVNGDYNGV